MFKINRRIDYAVRVMVSLASRAAGTRLPTEVIQAEMQIPPRLLRRIVADLGRTGLLRTFPGPKGGLELALPAGAIHLRHIWEAIEGPLLISDCLEDPAACPLESVCPVNACWMRLQDHIVGELESIFLVDLAASKGQHPAGISFQAPRPLSQSSVTVFRS